MAKNAPAVLATAMLSWGCAQASADTEAVSLGYSQETGPNPYVFFTSEDVERAVSFEISYSADPIQSLEISHRIYCRRGSESVNDKSETVTITPPLTIVVPATITEPDSCWLSVDAETPFETAVTGTVRIDVTATRTPEPPTPPYWQRCSRPGWLVRGGLKIHGESLSCRAAKKIARRAWNRPERQGHVVHVGKYFCSRSGKGRRVVVSCSHSSDRLKLVGKKRSR
ncbi:MAG: hypothetical protein R2725_04485 [Solirubrobacterales bacterium]